MARNVAPSRRARRSAWALTAALIGVVGASCAPPSPSGPSAVERFCDLWNEVAEKPPAPDDPVQINQRVLAYPEDTELVGGDCSNPAARVALDSAIVSDAVDVDDVTELELGDEDLELDDEPEAAAGALVNGDDLGPGQLVLDTVAVTALSASVGAYGIQLTGNVAVRLSGVTSTIGFVGTLSSLDDWSLSLSSSALTIPGISSTPVVFSGTLRSVGGVPSLSLTAHATSAVIGDITVHSATIHFTASPTAGVAASVQGSIRVGTSTVNGTAQVNLDRRGNLVSARADLTTRLVGIHVGGTTIDLQGSVHLDGNADETVVSFSGSGVLGDLVVHDAHGELELGDDNARFTGSLDVAQGNSIVRLHGVIVWDGVVAYVEQLTAEAGGQISATLNDGQQVTADGTLDLVMVDGRLRSVLTGDFTIGTLHASGTAIVEAVGATTVLDISAQLDLGGPGFGATVDGVVEITDGQAQLVRLDAVVDAEDVALGDLTLTGSVLQIRSAAGAPLDIRFAGSMRIDSQGGPSGELNGTLAASFGPTGRLLSLDGEVDGTLRVDPVTVSAVGTLTSTEDELTVHLDDVEAQVPGGDLVLSGTFTSSLRQPDWVLRGSGAFNRKGVDLALRRVIVTPLDGMVSVNVRAGAGPTYVRGDLQFRSDGECRFIVNRGGLVARLVAKAQITKKLGCDWKRRGQVKAVQSWVPPAASG